jgi:D-alanyl-D-alanine carboxypeptidase/D-alanyl-D-alanine-endopeptidase (penicillin-binding protein 4)
MFIPGSNAKVFSVSAVWNLLGADHRFTTPVYALGQRNGSKQKGNLVRVGVGDLSLGGRTTPQGGIAWTSFDHADANSIPGATLTPEDPLAGIKDLADPRRRASPHRQRGRGRRHRRAVAGGEPVARHAGPTPISVTSSDGAVIGAA